MRFTEAGDKTARYDFANQARLWGYPRSLEQDEVELSWWFRYGPAIFWLTPRDRDLQFHLAVDPDDRGRFARFFLTGVVVIAQLIGADRLVCFGEQTEHVASLLERWGWNQFDEGWEYSLDREGLPDERRRQEAASRLQAPG